MATKNQTQLPLMDFVKKDEVQELNEEIARLREDNAKLIEAVKVANDGMELFKENRDKMIAAKNAELVQLREQLDAFKKDAEFASKELIELSVRALPMLRAWRAMAVAFAPQGLNTQGVALLQRSTQMIDDMAELVK